MNKEETSLSQQNSHLKMAQNKFSYVFTSIERILKEKKNSETLGRGWGRKSKNVEEEEEEEESESITRDWRSEKRKG